MVKQAGAEKVMDTLPLTQCKERMIKMKFDLVGERKFQEATTNEKLTYICVMLEKIVDGMSQPQMIIRGNTDNSKSFNESPLFIDALAESKQLLEEKNSKRCYSGIW